MSAPFGAGPLRIITADERLREARGIKGVLTGTSGIGKTTQLLTLDPQRTLFLNLEAGELAVQGWPGDEIRIRDWEVARDLAAWIGGANPAMRDDQSYGPGHFARVCAAFGPADAKGLSGMFVSGAKDGNVFIWQAPSEADIRDHRIPNVPLTTVHNNQEVGVRQMRISIDVPNPANKNQPNGQLVPGRPVTIVVQ